MHKRKVVELLNIIKSNIYARTHIKYGGISILYIKHTKFKVSRHPYIEYYI